MDDSETTDAEHKNASENTKMRNKTTERPRGSNADEWHLFLCQYLDSRATSPNGLTFMAVQIAEAIDAQRERCAQLHESVNPASDEERLNNVPGAGAMGAVIEYRNLIRDAAVSGEAQSKTTDYCPDGCDVVHTHRVRSETTETAREHFERLYQRKWDQPEMTDFTIRGARAIRLVAVAIGNEIERYEDYIRNPDNYDDEIPNTEMDLALYRSILVDMGDPR